MLASKENHTWMIEEKPMKPTKDVEDVGLAEGDPSNVTKVGRELDPSMKEEMVEFVKRI